MARDTLSRASGHARALRTYGRLLFIVMVHGYGDLIGFLALALPSGYGGEQVSRYGMGL